MDDLRIKISPTSCRKRLHAQHVPLVTVKSLSVLKTSSCKKLKKHATRMCALLTIIGSVLG